ncbi:MAG: disulfide bond formation protein DsbA [Thalassobium sp.]|uniref:DsbA family protein n=1 Tax=Octadecabacter sp. SW4 TaxID=2602067 RepID=UPI000C0F0F45|nr:thioredoxin domain-containing protein [Octadecabacter sp. SW4]PHQ83492.1 MAG: disulfide bond formation protein DsbA [Thalassobium sp.]QEE37572.1 disulfide bond formation protein DsbA [Octadecabacter sp. SW4]|tara:strand:+ start:1498 stop:2157 length:660 start_codon:yes stop_codon:yes gene_type:complete
MNKKPLLIATLALAVAAFAVGAWYATRPAPVGDGPTAIAQADRLIRAYSPVLGPEDAAVTIVEFFDPACEACRAFHPIVKDILAQYPEDVRVVIRYTPFHGESSEAAILALEAARMQGIYLPVMDALMTNQTSWARRGPSVPGAVMSIAGAAGLDITAAESQMKMPDIVAIMNQDRADVETIGIRQTPTFFVNGKPLEPFGEVTLRSLVKSEVERAEEN